MTDAERLDLWEERAALKAEVERLRGVVEAELLRHDPNPQGAERRRRMTCEICSEIDRSDDGIWACSAGARLSAALAAVECGPFWVKHSLEDVYKTGPIK